MPEGHTLHRLALQQDAAFRDRLVAVSSPQGRFAEGAAQVDGRRLEKCPGPLTEGAGAAFRALVAQELDP